jgi:prepilin-type N-terminal cleavage/methylation domain-containing protein
MYKNIDKNSNMGFTIVELLVVIVIVGILAVIATVGYSGVAEKASRAVAVADLNNVHKLVENYQTENMVPPNNIDQTNDNRGFTASEGSIIRYTATGSNYCITVNRGSYYIMYDSTTGSNTDGYCEGHGPAEPAEIAYYSGMNNYPAANTTYPITPGVALQNDDVIVSFHSEHYIGGSAYLKIDGVNQSHALDKQLGTGADRFRATVVTNVTPSTLLSFTTDTGGDINMAYYIIRGLQNPDTYNYTQAGWSGGTVSNGTIITVPGQSFKTGQIAILAVNTVSFGDVASPYNPEPSMSNWTTDNSYTGATWEIGLAHAIGTADTTTVSSSIRATDLTYMGGTILVFGS